MSKYQKIVNKVCCELNNAMLQKKIFDGKKTGLFK